MGRPATDAPRELESRSSGGVPELVDSAGRSGFCRESESESESESEVAQPKLTVTSELRFSISPAAGL